MVSGDTGSVATLSSSPPIDTNEQFQQVSPLLPHLSPRTFEYDSLNYERIINQYFIAEQTRHYRRANRKIFGYTGKTATRWILTVLTGVLTALVAKTLMQLIDILSRTRTHKLDDMQHSGDGSQLSEFKMFAIYASWNLLLTGTSCLMVIYIAPQAAGSGIAEVKAYLNGTYIPYFLSFRAFFVKLFGTVLSVSSGLVVGPEGPLVHLGALIGSALTRGAKNFRFVIGGKQYAKTFSIPFLVPFRNDSDRRDFISIGVAAGFAAAFGAPIGGVLFSLEEASTYWSGKLMWRALTATTLACLVLNALTGKDLSYFGLISLKTHQDSGTLVNYNSITELPAYGALGVLGGLLGALYNATYQMMAAYRPRSNLGKLFEVLLVSLITSTVIYFAAIHVGVCSDTREDWLSGSDFSLRFNCEEGKYNELASLIFGVKEEVIKEIIYDPSRFSPITLLTCFLIFFPLQLLAFGIAVPCGIFMPSILVGCMFGGFFGNYLKDHWYRRINPGSYALMGAVAVLGGIQRTTISLCVIMMEGTGETEYLLPIIFTTVVANYIGNYFNQGVYELGLHLKRIPFLEHEIHHEFHVFQARHVMSADVQVLSLRETVENIISLLASSKHSGFPVVSLGSRKLVGFILRDQLYTMLESLDLSTPKRRSEFLQNIQVPNSYSHHRFEALLSGNLSDMEKAMVMDLEPAMNIGPHIVTPECPLSRAYLLFCSMGLRHLMVVDSNHCVVGVITRKDLLAVERILRDRNLSFDQKSLLIQTLQHSKSSEENSNMS